MDATDTLELLKRSSNDDLQPLVEYILRRGGRTEGLSGTAAYTAHYPEHVRYATEIYEEIRRYGGNSFANAYRSEGPAYEELVRGVAKRFKVKAPEQYPLPVLEEKIIQQILDDYLKSASDAEREAIEEALGQAGVDKKDWSAFVSGAAFGASTVGVRLAIHMLTEVIAWSAAKQALGHGLRMAGNAAFGRVLGGLAGPVGWTVTGVWTAIDVAGPAYRVTVPCVLHIAMLRQKYLHAEAVRCAGGEAFADE